MIPPQSHYTAIANVMMVGDEQHHVRERGVMGLWDGGS